MTTPTYEFVNLPRLYPGWKDQPDVLERYWDQAMAMIEQLQQRVAALEALE